MKTNPNSEQAPDEALLDAMLRDDAWQAANAAFKAEALNAFRAGHRARRARRWAGALAALAALVASGIYYFDRPAVSRPQLAAIPAPVPAAPTQPRPLTDQELIAVFPKGSCFIAEVDGKKQLIFLDPQLAQRHVGRTAVRAN